MYFSRSVSVILILVCFVPLSLVAGEGKENGNKADILLRIQAQHGEEGSKDSGLKLIRAGEEDEESSTTTTTTTEGPGSGNSTDGATDIKQCDTERGCCYQYTWPGPDYDSGTYNFTCSAYYRSSGKTNPCKEPVVFTIAEKENQGRRPNITELVLHCEENKCNVFCAKTSCIKYSYFREQSDGSRLWNETRFCGTVLRDGGNIENGCYKEKLSGFTREICVCNGNACNPATNLMPLSLLTYLAPLMYLTILFCIR